MKWNSFIGLVALFIAFVATGYRLFTAPIAQIGPRVEKPSIQVCRKLPSKRMAEPAATQRVQTQLVSVKSGLLWQGSIDLECRGEDTKTNVSKAVSAIDMTILHPNEMFSFNDLVGIRSEKKGYVPGLMYSNGQVVKGVGGGICIVSTLLYNAAMETGFKIIERHPHSGPVSYAEPGRDSAVAFGCEDLVFKNNTGSMILIRAVVEDEKLSVSIFGCRKPGRTVEIVSEDFQEIPYKIIEKEDPTLTEDQIMVDQKARPGFSVSTLRIIKQNGKVVSREVLSHDVIQPQDKIVRTASKPLPSKESVPTNQETVPTHVGSFSDLGVSHQVEQTPPSMP